MKKNDKNFVVKYGIEWPFSRS